MKNLFFSAYTLEIGGIETALVNLLNNLITQYNITLILEKKQGTLLNNIDARVNIIEYNPSQNKNVIIRKTINLLKRIKFILKYKNKFSFSASYASYSKMGSFCARTASKNNVLWIHTDYLAFYNNDKNKMIKFFRFIRYNKFKKIVCVSETSKNSVIQVFPELKGKIMKINNLIDYKNIIKKSEDKIELQKTNITTFLNVARHDERSKKITRIINVAERLKKEKMNFRVLLIGSGKETEIYKNLVNEKNLDSEIIFLGEKTNPYPYFKISDALILTSDYEGYPVVFDEARALNLPIITTNVSDSKNDIENKFGIVSDKDEQSIYSAMKKFINEGYNIKSKFDVNSYNREIIKKIEKLINGGNNA